MTPTSPRPGRISSGGWPRSRRRRCSGALPQKRSVSSPRARGTAAPGARSSSSRKASPCWSRSSSARGGSSSPNSRPKGTSSSSGWWGRGAARQPRPASRRPAHRHRGGPGRQPGPPVGAAPSRRPHREIGRAPSQRASHRCPAAPQLRAALPRAGHGEGGPAPLAHPAPSRGTGGAPRGWRGAGLPDPRGAGADDGDHPVHGQPHLLALGDQGRHTPAARGRPRRRLGRARPHRRGRARRPTRTHGLIAVAGRARRAPWPAGVCARARTACARASSLLAFGPGRGYLARGLE